MEAMDDVLRTKADDDRFVHRDMHLSSGNDIVLRCLVLLVKADKIRRSYQPEIGPSKLSVRARIMKIPHELLRRHLNRYRVLRQPAEIVFDPDALSHEYQDDKNQRGT